ncbi:MAG TPA: universal stress protein [Gaiellaceae bacterium]|jgi:APA family basic amino acid/polyamine antiporter|nr:universal stress protein [Gaiellaceae bacterium]
MPRRRHGLERVLGIPALAAIAYGEVGSSVWFALGIVSAYALGLTPWVLLAVGFLFMVVALAYAEGTAAMPEPGGAATFVRRAFNDPAGFAVGWVIFLDYLIVIALAALFVPHYLGNALEVDQITDGPWDALIGVGVIALIAGVRLVRRTRMYRVVIGVAAFTAALVALVVVLALALLFSPGDVTAGPFPSAHSLFFALALATLAYTGLETVANFAAEVREPGRALPRSLFIGLAASVVTATLAGIAWLAALPAGQLLGGRWVQAPLVGIVDALRGELPEPAVDGLRVFVGLAAVLVLVGVITTSISGAGRLAHVLAQRQMLPRAFGRLSARTLISPVTIVAATALAAGLLVVAAVHGEPTRFLASLYSFGILLAFTGAQLAVLRLRMVEPDLERPFRARPEISVRGHLLPLPTLLALPVTAVLWVAALATHAGARVAGPIWLAFGLVVYVVVRRREREGVFARVEPAKGDLVPELEGVYRRILVPLKGGPIGDEVLATALKLASEHRADVEVMHVVRVPLDAPLDGAAVERETEAELSIREAKELAAEQGVEIRARVVRSRSIGDAIIESARDSGVDVIVLGSAPRWRRQSRFFSPTVDHVLRHADCEVMVVAYPEGVLEDELE